MSDFKTEDQEGQNDNPADTGNFMQGSFNDEDETQDDELQYSFPTELELQNDPPADPADPSKPAGDNPTPPTGDESDDLKFDDADNEEEEDEDIDLEKFNKQMGTDFKSAEELRQTFKKEEHKDTIEAEEKEYNLNESRINVFGDYLKKDDRELIKLDYIAQYRQQNKDVNSPEVLQEIEDKIDGLEQMGELDAKAKLLRGNLSSVIDQMKSKNNSIKSKWDEAEAKIGAENKKSLQNFFVNISKDGNFFGVQVDNKALNSIYNNITSGKFFEEVNKDQESIAELALFRHYKEQIQKNAVRPTHSDGVKAVMDQIQGQTSQRTFNNAKSGTSGNETSLDKVRDFVK